MTAKATKKAEFPNPPAGWLPSDFRDPGGPWARGLRELDADGADTSGADNALRAVRLLAWGSLVQGDSVHDWRRRLDAAGWHRAQIDVRIAGLERQGLSEKAEAVRREIEAADKNVAALEELIRAAEAWTGGPGNVVLRQQYESAIQHHEQLAAAVDRYRQARLPVPDPSWENELYASELKRADAEAAWDAGRAKLDALSAELTKQTKKAFAALVGALAHVADRLGESCARIVNAGDVEFLLSFPHRADDALVDLHARAVFVSDLMDQLGSDHGLGMSHFWRVCGEDVAAIVAARCDVGGFIPRGRSKRAKSDAEIMSESF